MKKMFATEKTALWLDMHEKMKAMEKEYNQYRDFAT